MNNEQLLELAEMFDSIVNSDNPAVQRSFQHTVLLATLAEEKKSKFGPFETILRDVTWMREELQSLRREIQIMQNQSSNDGAWGSFKEYNNLDTAATLNILSGGGIAGGSTYVYSGTDTITIGNISITDIGSSTDYITMDNC